MKFEYSRRAQSQLTALPRVVQKRISSKMSFFAEQPDPLRSAKKLKGYDLYRFRVGDYRIVFEVVQHIVLIVTILKRDDAYKDL